MVWELPLLGVDFALLRLLANLPLPIIAGLLARKLPGIAPRVAAPDSSVAARAPAQTEAGDGR
jgi:hypothetical protein